MASDLDPRFDPKFQRGYDGPLPVAEALEARPRVEPRPLVEPSSLVEALETKPTYRNPWLLALWIVAAGFTATGVAAQYAAQSILQGEIYNSAINYYVVPATIEALSPWFVLAGLLAGVAALVLSAIRWRPVAE